MNDDPRSILERLDVHSIKSEIGRLLDHDPNVMQALVAAARGVLERASAVGDREHMDEAAYDWATEVGFDSFEEAFTRERVVTCGNPAGHYELWGLEALELAGRGYVIDWGENRDDARVWSSWSPTDEQRAFELAVLKAWWSSWESIGLPPLLGDCWQGNGPLVYRAVESLVSRSGEAREYLWNRFPDLRDQQDEPDWTLFGLPWSDSPDVANLPTEPATALADPTQRQALVALFLTLTHGCP
jgi:hypothetical protein